MWLSSISYFFFKRIFSSTVIFQTRAGHSGYTQCNQGNDLCHWTCRRHRMSGKLIYDIPKWETSWVMHWEEAVNGWVGQLQSRNLSTDGCPWVHPPISRSVLTGLLWGSVRQQHSAADSYWTETVRCSEMRPEIPTWRHRVEGKTWCNTVHKSKTQDYCQGGLGQELVTQTSLTLHGTCSILALVTIIGSPFPLI